VSYFDNAHKMHVGAKKYLILLFDFYQTIGSADKI